MSGLSLATLLHQLGHRSGSRSLRAALGLPAGSCTLTARRRALSILTHNMGLLPTIGFVDPYLAPSDFRPKAIAGFCAHVRETLPDLVGVCEAFVDDERATVRSLLPMYPYALEGPDEDDLEQDGGLLLLSRHPILASNVHIYRECAGADALSNKGVLHVRIQPEAATLGCDVFYTHMQAIYDEGEGRVELQQQLASLGVFLRTHRDPELPAFVVGDLNFPGEGDPALYTAALASLGQPADLWLAQDPVPSRGITWAADNDFYADADDDSRPSAAEEARLDYILLLPGLKFAPLLQDIEVVKLRMDGRCISDHYGLRGRFGEMLEIARG